MQEGYSNHSIDEYQEIIEDFPNLNDSFNREKKQAASCQFIRISKKQEKIDADAILNQYAYNHTPAHKQVPKNVPQMHKKPSAPSNKKIQKVPARKKFEPGFSYIKTKHQVSIDQILQRIKSYIIDTKYSFNLKHKEALFELSRCLIIGVFELKQYSKEYGNDITRNQKNIISEDTDIYEWTRILIENFDSQFQKYEQMNKNMNLKNKWEILVKNCKDQTNFELRRKILRKKILPNNVLQNDEDFLLSQQAKINKERELRLILAEAEQDLGKQPTYDNVEENNEELPAQQSQENIEIPTIPIITRKSYDSQRVIQQNQKLNEWQECIGEEPVNRMRKRIIEDLAGTSSYEILMRHFQQTFGRSN